jgi:hypothetical protein
MLVHTVWLEARHMQHKRRRQHRTPGRHCNQPQVRIWGTLWACSLGTARSLLVCSAMVQRSRRRAPGRHCDQSQMGTQDSRIVKECTFTNAAMHVDTIAARQQALQP